MSEAVNHHYVPQFYLRNFAEGIGRQARIVAFDAKTGKKFPTAVRNVASQRNFNRIEAEGFHPNFIETESAQVESQIAPRLQEVITSRSFPSEEHKLMVMELAATMSARNPGLRRNLAAFQSDIAKRMLSLSLQSKERWEAERDRMPPDEVPECTYEEIKQFFDQGGFDIEIDQTHLIQQELEMVRTVFGCLVRRNWCFLSNSEGADFITSDYPTVLTWTSAMSVGPYSPGHGLAGTRVILPLTPTLAILGQFEAAPNFLILAPDRVTEINTNVARHALRQLYARNDTFRLNLKSRLNVMGRELAMAIHAEKRQSARE